MVNTVWGMLSQPLFEITEPASLPLAICTQQAEIYALAQTCPLAKAKSTNIYTDSQYAFGQFITLEYYGNNEMSLPPVGIRLKMTLMSKMY